MIHRLKQDRREHPRLEKNLPFKVAVNGYDFSTTTQNISCLGAYCHIDKYVPPFTKVCIKLSLPMKDKGARHSCSVECKGVVVRTTDDAQGKGFNIAVFFNGINEAAKNKISRYINQCLPEYSLSANLS